MRNIFLFLIFSLLSFSAIAQNGTIRGFVYDKDNGEPVMFTNVFLKGTTIGASTDVNGFFTISKVPLGTYTLTCTYLGFDTVEARVEITRAGQIINQRLNLTKQSISLGVVEVSAEKEAAKTTVQIGVTSVSPKQINKIPSVGGQPDLAQYLQVLPGVVFTGDQGGQLYIRGGSPIQNKVMIDGMIIYNPFHSIGLFSVFETDIIRNAEVNTGGFNAEHGGRVSAVMDITTRDGNGKRITGKIGASPFTSRLLLEGPLSKKKDGTASNNTFILTGRTSYLEQTSKVLYDYADTSGLPFNFTDLYGKVSFKADNGSKLNLFGFNFNDRVNFRDITKINWNSFGAGANFLLIPSTSSALIKGNIAFSDYKIVQEEKDGLPRTSNINGFNFGLNFSYFMGKNQLDYGFDINGFRTLFEFNNFEGQNENTTELNGFVKYRFVTDKLVIEPGFRMQYYSSLAEFSPEPRIGIKYNATDRIRLKFAAGLYSQNLISAISDRDVVNLFYGFLSGPDNLPRTFDGQPVTSKLQKAQHAVAGVEVDVKKNVEVNFETYIKNFSQITNINRDKLFQDIPSNFDKAEVLRKDFIVETGMAYGFDTRLKYEYKRWYLWTTYSLAWVNRYDSIRTYFTHFDRRHNINILLSYNGGKDKDLEFSARFNFGSGFPFTQTQGFFNNIQFDQGIGTDILTQNGDLGILYGEINNGRLPTYHRLDLNVKKTFLLTDRSDLEVNFSVTNAYNRENIFYFDRVRFSRVNQLPILPSIGVTLSF